MELSKVAIIAAPTKEPRAVIQQSFGIAEVFAPTLVAILQYQQLFGIAFLSLYNRAHWLTWQIYRVCEIITSQAYVASRYFQYHVAIIVRAIWKAKTVQSLRKKIVFEFFALFLGSGGNSLCLLLFWPGWWVVGLIGLTARLCVG
ncbi:hypothetical protein F4781DRAFT_363898 [Annulohypoxylon bovei var. microspora]|nr:hypothetical protein F4781DRAFT_363898 [Annulohypoxylon bovei var. microspora]